MARGGTLDDFVELLRAYVHQETVEPLRALGRYLIFGVIGSLCLGVGAVLVAIGGVGGLQAWGVLEGWWSWVPYLAAGVFLIATGAVAVSVLGRGEQSRG